MTQNLAHKKGVKQDRTKIRDAALRIIREILERPDYWNRQRASRGPRRTTTIVDFQAA